MFTLISRFTKDESTDDQSTDADDTTGIATDTVTVERNDATVRRTVACDGGEISVEGRQESDQWYCEECDHEDGFDTLADLKRHAANSTHPAHMDESEQETTEFSRYAFVGDDGQYRVSVTQYEDGTIFCDDCDDDGDGFDSKDELRAHIEQSDAHSPIDSDADEGTDESADGAGFYDEEADEFYEFPSDGPDYPDHIPGSRPDGDGLRSWLKHNWNILTNRDDPGGIDWMKVHLRAYLDDTDNAFKQSVGGIGLAGVHYLDINRSVLRWTWKEAKKFGSSGTDFAKSGAKMLIGLAVFNQVTSWPAKVAISKLGLSGLTAYLPIQVSAANISTGVAMSGIMSGAGVTSALAAALPLAAVGGIGAYIFHDGFRETVKSAARGAIDTVKDVASKVKDTVSGWFSSSSEDAAETTAEAVPA